LEKIEGWLDVGSVEELQASKLQVVRAGSLKIALSCVAGEFGAISNACNHVGGPLGEGNLEGEFVVCPWHQWKFHRVTGTGEAGYENDRVPSYPVKIEEGRIWVHIAGATKRQKSPHEPHPLARDVVRLPGAVRIVGISTTVMDEKNPRYSGSDDLLTSALKTAGGNGCETRLIRLNSLGFHACRGYYSKSARACTWPCSITQMDQDDELEVVYEALVHWADVVLIATPIRWGAASSLYFKMAERLNCIQNQVTTHNKVLLRNKVAGFIIVGGQDNVQGVAGQLLNFFGELGMHFPQFPFVGHSRGWTAEDMEQNVATVKSSRELHEGAAELAGRCIELAKRLLETEPAEQVQRGGRKAHALRDAILREE
jgi:nitrite reductase/ring-hydroxylating ferredoxin subunit/multimeric flavodoxin WrbA